MYEYRYKNKKILTYEKLENQLEKRKKITLLMNQMKSRTVEEKITIKMP